ncbi:transcriptional regulator [Amylibacter marinus]|uniref:Transcriptional regulator n=1 Tax=Amylibacter marinus TaxID=1475483 RepID=A0ABQ5VQX9_9RHOB|nr:LysR family transcriptional regulator [Amylibacter marinus]GLQ33815.1 transcriptional regulator [Amylibacter marinus]
MLPNLKSLGVFAKVAETGSFAAAAKVLNISAPVVSQHISQLEKNLDTALVYRSTRSLTLTVSGEKLAAHARDMLDAAETGLEELQDDIKEHSGVLTMTMPSFLAAPKFTRVLKEFSDAHPKILVEVSYSTEFVNLIDNGFDMAIRVGQMPDSNLRARKLMDGHGCLYASPELIEKHGCPQKPEDLEAFGFPWIGAFRWSGEWCLQNVDDPEKHFKPKIEGPFHMDNGEAEKQMALISGGIAIMPEMYVTQELAEGSLVRVLPDWTTDPVGVYAVWPQNAGKRSLTKLFVDFLTQNSILMDEVLGP